MSDLQNKEGKGVVREWTVFVRFRTRRGAASLLIFYCDGTMRRPHDDLVTAAGPCEKSQGEKDKKQSEREILAFATKNNHPPIHVLRAKCPVV